MNVEPTATFLDRRSFLQAAGLTALGAGWRPGLAAAEGDRKIKVAAVVTEFYYRSHAHVILENFLEPYLFDGKRTDPGCEVISLFVEQVTDKDMSRSVAKEYKIPTFPTIAGALTLGGSTLAADAVLLIGEHGEYPVNAKGQTEYPRRRFFDEIVAVFEKTGKVAPVFNDKHLSYRWDWAEAMVADARRLKIPFMAGSSVPLAERRPAMELPAGSEVLSAIAIHGGPFESYDFHGLEILQSVIEARKGGETGVSSVQFLEGDALWRAAEDGLWSPGLADAAMAAEIGPGKPTLRELVKTPPYDGQPLHGLLLTYKDGLHAAVLRVGKSATRWNLACLAAGDESPRATTFYTGPWNNRNLFKALAHAIQTHFRDRRPPYPVERTLLTTGVLEAATDSRLAAGKILPTPHLEFAYTPTDFRALRETGATWKIITPDFPQPKGIDNSGRRLGSS